MVIGSVEVNKEHLRPKLLSETHGIEDRHQVYEWQLYEIPK